MNSAPPYFRCCKACGKSPRNVDVDQGPDQVACHTERLKDVDTSQDNALVFVYVDHGRVREDVDFHGLLALAQCGLAMKVAACLAGVFSPLEVPAAQSTVLKCVLLSWKEVICMSGCIHMSLMFETALTVLLLVIKLNDN